MITKIWVGKGLVNIKPTDMINSTRRLHSFCSYNSIRDALVKSQGGWYWIGQDGRLELVATGLCHLSFEQFYNFVKRRDMKITRENISKHLIEKELELAGKTLLDTMDDDNWYFNFTL